ncbi:MAG: TrmH family RNA methyltransferase, partial [Candidatus Dormibacteraceae bacterium]
MIDSPSNQVVRRFRQLGRRRPAGEVLLEGPRVVKEAVACGVELELVALCDGFHFDLPAEQTVIFSERALAAAADTVTPQGVLAIGRYAETSLVQAKAVARAAGWPLLVLDRLQDPGNVGTICRSAAAAGAPAMVALEGGADPLGAKAIRASAGAVFRLQLARASWLELDGMSGFGAVPVGGMAPSSADLAAAQLIAIGSEAHGLRRHDLAPVTIPMATGVESLNAAVAAALL